MTGLNHIFEDILKRLVSHLADSLNLEEDDVQEAFNSYEFNCEKPSKPKTASTLSKPKDKSTVSEGSSKPKSATKGSSSKQKCSYTYQKGEKNGTMCSAGAGHEVDGKMYCATHAKSVSNATQKPTKKSSTPAPKTKLSAKHAADENSKDLVNRLVKDNRNIKKNKWNNYVDHDTNIVFDKQTKKALGNQLSSGKIGPLTKEQMDACEMHHWAFDAPKSETKAKSLPTPPPPKSKPKPAPVIEESEPEDVSELEDVSDLDLEEEEEIVVEDDMVSEEEVIESDLDLGESDLDLDE